MDSLIHAPLDPSGREIKNVYNILLENEFNDLISDNIFSTFFSTFNIVIDKEKKFFEKNLN